MLRKRLNSWLIPVMVLVLGLGAGVAITTLYRHVDASRNAQLEISALKPEFSSLLEASFQADRRSGGSAAKANRLVAMSQAAIDRHVRTLVADGSAPPALDGLRPAIARLDPTIRGLIALGDAKGFAGTPETNSLVTAGSAQKVRVLRLLNSASASYDRAARRDRTRAEVGTFVTLVLLLSAFLLFYRRSVRARQRAETLAGENERLWQASHDDAITDELTGLGNRRALTQGFEALLAEPPGANELLLAMFDLDGFKQYNDTFGHGAGDALLTRLGERLAATMGRAMRSYRMGGDEFCILGRAGTVDGFHLVDAAVKALSETGDGWRIGCSYGVVWVPSQAQDMVGALRVADQRMYANKASRSSASRQTAAALLQVLAEQGDGLDAHADAVADLAVDIAKQLGVPAHEVQHIRLAAELHDIGKAAIPEAILNKPGPLDEAEWAFIHRHTLIGERIILAAPTLDQVAKMVRSSHERVDGTGYPDRLTGDAIPVGSRIIAVADAFHAMISARPYGRVQTDAEAVAELERCAGTQFDAGVVAAFLTVRDRPALAA